jgi:hypothetical protein
MKKTSQDDKASPEISLVETIGESDLGDLSVETTEFLLDQLLQEGSVRDFPIISSIVGLVKFGISIRDYVFLKKTVRFLYHLKDIPPEERMSFSKQLSSDKAFQQRVGENLILMLDRLDDMKKPEILAQFFKAYINGKIDLQTYERLAIAVDRVKIHSLPSLLEFYRQFDGNNFDQLMDNPTLPHDDIQDLIYAGLIDIRFMPNVVVADMSNFESGVTKLGKLFVEIALKPEEKTA